MFCGPNVPSRGLLESRQMLSHLPLDFWRESEVPSLELDPDTKPGRLHTMILLRKDVTYRGTKRLVPRGCCLLCASRGFACGLGLQGYHRPLRG